MTRYAFTGPSHLTPREALATAATVRGLDRPTAICTGGAPGWDVLCAGAALEAWPDADHRIYVPEAPYDAVAVGVFRALGATVIHVGPAAPGSPAAYRARNEAMVAHADVLVAGLRRPTFYRSGEWMTVNIARRRGIPVNVVDLSPRS